MSKGRHLTDFHQGVMNMKMNKVLMASMLTGLLTLSSPALAQEQPSEPAASAVVTSININTASAEQLTLLSGIGTAKASAIVAYREQNGPFDSVDDLTKVSGIGAATIEKNRHLLTE
ncbi:ComEA family DNA-binding protein [Oceanisphaera profunda]